MMPSAGQLTGDITVEKGRPRQPQEPLEISPSFPRFWLGHSPPPHYIQIVLTFLPTHQNIQAYPQGVGGSTRPSEE